jgi:hypothetical protein
MAMFRRGNNHRNSTEVEAHAPGGNRGIPSGSGSIAGGATASPMAQLGSSRRAALHTRRPRRLRAASVPPWQWWRWWRKLRMAVATLAAYHRVRVASPEVLQRLRWRYEGGAHGFTPAHQPLHRAGDAGGHDLKTTSWLRHTRNVHSLG